MITARIKYWLQYKWMSWHTPELLRAYQMTFSTLEGKIVLQDLMDRIYCAVPHTKDPIELAQHAGARAVIHGILEKIELSEQPDKFKMSVEGIDHARG